MFPRTPDPPFSWVTCIFEFVRHPLTWQTTEIDHRDNLCSQTSKSCRISSASGPLFGKEPLYRNSSDILSSLPLSSFRGCFLFLLLFLPLHNGAPHGNNSLHVRAGPLHSSPVGLIPGNRKGFWQGPLFPECVNEGGRGKGAFGVAKSEGRGQDWAKIKILRASLPHASYFSLFSNAPRSLSGKLSLSFQWPENKNRSFNILATFYNNVPLVNVN